MRRIKMIIEYDGSNYHGFQIQQNAHTIQAEIEESIYKLTGEKTSIVSAGRTDTGVHALGQVIAFNTISSIPPDKWRFALNSFLPQDMQVVDSREAVPDFHPRFDAVSKQYSYFIYRKKSGRVFYRKYALCNDEELNIEAMKLAGTLIEGAHNFKSFCASGSSAKTFERTVNYCRFEEKDCCLVMNIEANGFLYNMVRIIMGTLLEVGRGNFTPEYVQKIIAAEDRSLAGPTASPQGLYMVRVNYST